MATYFHVNSEIQPGDHGGMQTLYLMNPNYIPYSDTTSLSNNTLLLNPVNFSHAPPPPPSNDHHHPLVGIPLPAPPSDDNNINRSSSFHYDLWSSIDTHMASLAPASNSSAPLGLSRPVASVPSRQQGLSLSLSSQQVAAYNRPIDHHHNHTELMRVSDSSPSSVTVVSSGISSMQSSILGSKYLRATQEILDEVVKVDQIIIKTDHSVEENKKLIRDSNMTAVDHDEEPNGTNRPYDLTTAQRQELQTKKAKLVNMLDEVEQRYKQYHHQIQLVVSAFEQAAGIRSAKSYTAVALRTISKQFRCLKDAITGQLKETSKKLGEDDCLGAKAESSRLRFVDQLRQQRGLQQLGMMQHQAWRPQRGLPERAVTILRAWLFEHFLHPYPKDSDKQQLAKQTGLTRSQVSNWFINARVRLWKPMVEEMYLEEVKEQERNGSGSTSKTESKESHHDHLEQIKGLQAKAEKSITHIIASPTELSNSTISTSPMGGTLQQQNSFNLIGPSDLEGFVQRRQKKPRNAEMLLNSPSSILSIDMEMKQGETSREIGRERHSVNDLGGGFCTYLMESDMGRFNPVHHQQQQHHHHHQLDGPAFHGNNGVSLTLGLPHGENLSLSGTQHNLLSGQNVDHLGSGLELGSSTNEPDFCPDSTGYESIDIQNRKGFAAQLLPDFMT